MEKYMEISTAIEAILFFKNEPTKISDLAATLEVSQEEVEIGVATLRDSLRGHGIVCVQNEGQVLLSTAPEASSLIEKLSEDEIKKEIGKAGLETLALVLYKGPISRKEIDYVRGVNSTYILRNLLIRGLVDKKSEGRVLKYSPTLQTLSFLGITSTRELPQFEEIISAIQKVEKEDGE
jgi:segregation and condensation protein B